MIAIREAWPSSLKERLAAAYISNNLGIGMDYAKRHYMSGVTYPGEKYRLDERFEGMFTETINWVEAGYNFQKPADSKDQDFFYYFGFRKGLGSLEAAHTIAQQGYLSEPLVLCRSAIESISWCNSVSLLPDGAEPLKLTTTRSISLATIAEPVIGRLYGISSKFAHWNPETHLPFLKLDEGGPQIIMRAIGHKVSALVFLMCCLSLYVSSFHRHMTRYYPGKILDRFEEILNNLNLLASDIVMAAKGNVNSESLLGEIWAAWETKVSNAG